jgi:polyisoprenyl-phosphate glycosyltransferase
VKKISIVAPMYNEEETAQVYLKEMAQVLNGIKDIDYEIIAVDDGSRDSTLNILLQEKCKYPKLGIVKLSRNFGLEGAVYAGLKSATGDAVITMDTDLQDPPSLVKDLVKLWQDGYDVVNAKRSKRPYDSFLKRYTAASFYKLTGRLSGKIRLEENAANYKLLSRRVVDTIKSIPEVNRVFRILVPFAGFKTSYVEYTRDQRYAGVTKYSYGSLLKYAMDGITSAGIEPLKYITPVGVALIASAVISGLVLLILTLKGSPAWILLIVMAVLLLFGIQFLFMGIMAEYIGQVFIEVKHRPISIIEEFIPPSA